MYQQSKKPVMFTEASNQNLPVQPGTVWCSEDQVSGNSASPESHCFDPFYGVGVSDRKALSAPAHFSAEHSTVSANSMSHQLSLLFPDIEPSIIDTILETVGGSINTAAEWLLSNANTDSNKANSRLYDVQGKETLGTPIAIKFEHHVNDESENDSTKTGSLNQALCDIPVHPFSESLTSLLTSDAQQRKKKLSCPFQWHLFNSCRTSLPTS